MCETDTEREGKILNDLIEKTSTIHYRIIHSSLSTSKSFDSCVVSAASYSSFIYVDLCILFPIQICNRNWWNKSECTHLSFSKYETQHTYTHTALHAAHFTMLSLSLSLLLSLLHLYVPSNTKNILPESTHTFQTRVLNRLWSLLLYCASVCVCVTVY